MIGDHAAGDREQPWLDRPSGIVGMPGAVQRHEYLLVEVIALGLVPNPATKKRHHDRPDIVEQFGVAGGIAALSLGHEYRPTAASLRVFLPYHIGSYPGEVTLGCGAPTMTAP